MKPNIIDPLPEDAKKLSFEELLKRMSKVKFPLKKRKEKTAKQKGTRNR